MPYAIAERQRIYQRDWKAGRRAAWIAAHGPCKQCGSDDGLEIDHIDPATKTAPIAQIWSWSAARRDAELAKCQVLCRPCHDEKTNQDFGHGSPQHGTTTRYRDGCRCEPCRDANRTTRQAAGTW